MRYDPAPTQETDPQLEKTIEYEEMPIIEPIVEAPKPPEPPPPPAGGPPPPPPPPPQPPTPQAPPVSASAPQSRRLLTLVGSLVAFGVLFVAGMWLSTLLRQYLTPPSPVASPTPLPTPLPTLRVQPTTTETAAPATPSAVSLANWQTLAVVSGTTKQPISGLSYKLPPEVLPPVCDSGNCQSQGTYLPGGTRFTVAPRGQGQLLLDFRGAILTDASGREFTMTQITLAGRTVYNFTADFTGKTGAGFSFNKMRGVLIPLTEVLSVEFNHFAPSGVLSDFAADDRLFEEIVKTVTYQAK